MGVLANEGDVGHGDEDPSVKFSTLASAIADANGTFVSRRQPAGVKPSLLVSVLMMPAPVGSHCTRHQPRAWDRMTNVSPLITSS